MKKLLLLVIFALALFTSTTYVEINLPEANAATMPQESMQSYKLYSNGGGSDSSIYWDGTKFTLTENIEGTITIMDDGIVLDGAGFTVRGRGDSIGIAVYDKNAIIIKNINVENFGIGILLGHYSPDAFLWYDPNPNRSTNCTVSNCRVSNSSDGISITGGIKCKIIGNQVSNSGDGIIFSGVENFFRNNQLENNIVNFVDLTYDSDVDSSNTINGKPIYYLVNQENITVPADASMIHLEGCSNVIVTNLDIKHAYEAIFLFNSSNCKIIGNKLTENQFGISLRNSCNNSLIGNKLFNNSDLAIKYIDSENTTIAHNLIKSNGGGIDGMGYSAGSRNAIISDNQIIANNGYGIQSGTESTITGNYIEGNGQHGIQFWDISNSVVYKNTILQSGDCGISFRKGRNASIIGNDISKNKVGVGMGDVMGELSSLVITDNNFVQNINLAIRIDSDMKDSKVYLNNFIDNNNGSVQVLIKGRFVYKGDEGYDYTSKVFPQFVASQNAWDNGSVGNFWSDNNSTDGGVYKITDRNIDHYPLLAPKQFSPLEMPSIEVPSELLGTQKHGLETSFLVVLILAIFLPVITVTSVIIYKKLK